MNPETAERHAAELYDEVMHKGNGVLLKKILEFCRPQQHLYLALSRHWKSIYDSVQSSAQEPLGCTSFDAVFSSVPALSWAMERGLNFNTVVTAYAAVCAAAGCCGSITVLEHACEQRLFRAGHQFANVARR